MKAKKSFIKEKMKSKEGFIKEVGNSSEGISIIAFKSDKNREIEFITLNTHKIVGKSIDGDLHCFLSNNLRVFTPARIDFFSNLVSVKLTLEEVSFLCGYEKELPEFFKDFLRAEQKKLSFGNWWLYYHPKRRNSAKLQKLYDQYLKKLRRN